MRLRNDKRAQRIREGEQRNEEWRKLPDERKAFILFHERPGDSQRQLNKLCQGKPEGWLASALFEHGDGTPALGEA
jgi:hypothetical protein